MPQTYILIELTITALWIFVMIHGLKNNLHSPTVVILLAVIPISASAEITNLTLFQGQGTLYPHILIPFPGFPFPLAITLFTGLFALGVFQIASWCASHVLKHKRSIFVSAYLLLLFCSFIVEYLGTTCGYWHYQRQPGNTISRVFFYAAIYTFYLFATSPALFYYFLRHSRK